MARSLPSSLNPAGVRRRGRRRANDKGKKANDRKASGRLGEGAAVHGWKPALGALTIARRARRAGRS